MKFNDVRQYAAKTAILVKPGHSLQRRCTLWFSHWCPITALSVCSLFFSRVVPNNYPMLQLQLWSPGSLDAALRNPCESQSQGRAVEGHWRKTGGHILGKIWPNFTKIASIKFQLRSCWSRSSCCLMIIRVFWAYMDETNQCVVSHLLKKTGAFGQGALLFRWWRQSVTEVSAFVHRGWQGESAQANHLWEHQPFTETPWGVAGVGGE